MPYKTTIGLEVHAELATKSKMFCGCKNDPFNSEPNSNICPVCTGQPGALPVPNEQAIAMVLQFGQAIDANVATYSEFDRKNYFYPDLPKAYQISQNTFPFLSGGELEGVEITRVHLEEDTARNQHDKGNDSLVDFNRSSVPLMELVTEPVIHDSETAVRFARELQLLLRTLKISEANMEKGEMRVEANISVSKDDNQLGTKVEVKNLNSFKSVEGAIAFEVDRQIKVLESGGSLIQETRGWNENTLETFSQRAKEVAEEYRYFPDPDIPKIDTSKHSDFSEDRLAEKMAILPSKKRELYENLGLPSKSIEVLISHSGVNDFATNFFHDKTLKSETARLAANYLTSDVLSQLDDSHNISDLNPNHFKELMVMILDDKIGSRGAKDLLGDLFGSDVGPFEIAEAKGLLQMSDESALQSVVDEIISEQKTVSDEYKAGKEAAMQFLVGQGMKKTRGSANPALLKSLLEKSLK